jgi:hypothetical protein
MTNPFKNLPFPSPGDRIKAEDFRNLSQGLSILNEMFALSSALFGQNFGMAKLALASQQYHIQKAMSVFGNEINDPEDESLDDRKIILILPAELGERGVHVILTEAVQTRRLTPNLIDKTYTKAMNDLRSILADVSFPSTRYEVPEMTERPLSDAKKKIQK